jgi:hypothetical protein
MLMSESLRLVGLLAATGHGWTDIHVDVYSAEFAASIDDPECAEVAVRRIIHTWDKPIRIPIGVIIAEYRREVDRRAMTYRGISHAPTISAEEGMRLAWAAYQAEAERHGKRPNPDLFGKYAELTNRPTT